MQSQRVTVSGAVGGVFGGEPAVDLSASLPMGHATAFKFLKPHAGSTSKFFIRLSKAEADLGVGSVVELPAGKGNPPNLFEVDFELKAKETSVEVAAAGGMKGDWRNALGIKGLTLENPYLSVGINETGGFDTQKDAGVKGLQMLGNLMGVAANKSKTVEMALDLDGPTTTRLALQAFSTFNQSLVDKIKAGL